MDIGTDGRGATQELIHIYGATLYVVTYIGNSDGEINGFVTQLILIICHGNRSLFVDMFAVGKLDIWDFPIRYSYASI